MLRDVLTATTDLGYVVSNVEVARKDHGQEVVRALDAGAKGNPHHLVHALQQLGGVVDVRWKDAAE